MFSPGIVTFVIIGLVINLDDNQLLAAHPGGFYKSLPTGIESPGSAAGTRRGADGRSHYKLPS
jgi:hypothetical protein